MEDGTTYLDEELVDHLHISAQYLEQEKLHQIEEIKRRKSVFPRSRGEDDLNDNNKTVILVDDGAATDATIYNCSQVDREAVQTKAFDNCITSSAQGCSKVAKKGGRSRRGLVC